MNTTHGTQHGGRGLVLRLLLATVLVVSGCDFLDPTEVENPRTTSEDLAQAQNPVQALLPGLRAEFARLVNTAGVLPEVVSDNFSIHGTGLNGNYDYPALIQASDVNSTGDATGLYWNAQELKALASFVIDDIAPEDGTAAAADIAEAYYYRGMAYLTLAENFAAAPLEADGAPVPASDLLSLAIADLNQAGAFGVATSAALARAQRWAGNSGAAVSAADAALGADADFAFLQEFDASSITNSAWAYLVSRALQEMQPLPRLDFLDPKYLDRTQGIAVAKAEEMLLIKAEAALASGNLGTARTHLAAAIDMAKSRSTETFSDEDQRLNADLSIRPRSASIMVRADASSPYRAGLVLDRPGSVVVPTISDTSLDADSIMGLGSAAELWHSLWLARQEILFLEGRRMADLGIKLPIMLREIDANQTIDPGDLGTEASVPAWFPPENDLDLFTPSSPYDADGNLLTDEVTMVVDLNKLLAANNMSPFN